MMSCALSCVHLLDQTNSTNIWSLSDCTPFGIKAVSLLSPAALAGASNLPALIPPSKHGHGLLHSCSPSSGDHCWWCRTGGLLPGIELMSGAGRMYTPSPFPSSEPTSTPHGLCPKAPCPALARWPRALGETLKVLVGPGIGNGDVYIAPAEMRAWYLAGVSCWFRTTSNHLQKNNSQECQGSGATAGFT